jgi:large subunit ribosomal protein L2
LNLKFFHYKLNKKLVVGLVSNGGRNFLGRLCVYHRGAGNKNKYRFIDKFRRLNKFGILFRIVKDSIRSSFIGLIFYENGLISYISLSDGVSLGSTLYSGISLQPISSFYNLGSSFPILFMNLFSKISCVELFPLSGSKLARSAGVSAHLIAKDKFKGTATLKFNSG